MAVDDDECTVGLHFAKESLKELHEMLSVENALKAGCRVKKHPGACVLCVANNDCSRLPIHVHCFPADTEVSAGKVIRAYRRWYEGDLVEIVAGDQLLAGTPNHPVLTDRGWVALGALDAGHRVVGDPFDKCGITARHPDAEHMPGPIGELFDSLALTGSRERVPGRPAQFHGDGTHDDVDVVTVDGDSTPGDYTADAAVLRERIDGLAELDRITRVRRFPFAGHVYNLETASGWYLANSILSGNCRCRPEPFLSSMDE